VKRSATAKAAKVAPACPCGRTLVPLWRWNDLICPAGCRDDKPAARTADRWHMGGIPHAIPGTKYSFGEFTTWFNVFRPVPGYVYAPLVEIISTTFRPVKLQQPLAMIPMGSRWVPVEMHSWTGPAEVVYVAP
jgi:hypothetical protein